MMVRHKHENGVLHAVRKTKNLKNAEKQKNVKKSQSQKNP